MNATRALYDLVQGSYMCFKKCNATFSPDHSGFHANGSGVMEFACTVARCLIYTRGTKGL
jgi:hypothetical protein